MKTILFALPGNEILTKNLTVHLEAEMGELVIRQFPDGETYVKIQSDVKGKRVVLVCSLYQPNEKFLSLYFFSRTAKDLGAESICLVAPYLAYMRQDKRFQPGESVTSEYFAALISSFVDSIVTIDPHLHRKISLSEVYDITNIVMHATKHIAKWIKNHVTNPLLIGPDSESEQWVFQVAKNSDIPYIILNKKRFGDKEVEVSLPEIDIYKDHTPVLVDDIISTARTMIETINHLKQIGFQAPVCIGVHAVFAGNAYQELKDAGTAEIITCNTIPHQSNKIDISDLLIEGYVQLYNE